MMSTLHCLFIFVVMFLIRLSSASLKLVNLIKLFCMLKK
ncbi:unnamed protein product [Onchocerca flexuosa]|uniref:Uncharacterized protein n=1 Tax=Onchocerca flexuosa TaxID=387005 RepID=A0A183HVP5_9BILA|nr:unnamed protein product [Onchocerca flexuosa]